MAYYSGVERNQPVRSIMSEKCSEDIYKNGKCVAVISGARIVIEFIVSNASKESGQPIDWYYMAGRAIVKTTGDIEKSKTAIDRLMPERLQ